MSQDPSPKPLPAEPLPLKEWLKLTDLAEVGRNPFLEGVIRGTRFFVMLFQASGEDILMVEQ